MDVTKTQRGFGLIEFKDASGEPCSLQESSNIEPHLWLGCENNCKLTHSDGAEVSPRMNLSRDQVRELVAHLNRWLKTGNL